MWVTSSDLNTARQLSANFSMDKRLSDERSLPIYGFRAYRPLEGYYRILTRGQTPTFTGSPCWCSNELPPPGEGSPCDSSMVELYDSKRASCRSQGRWK